MQASELLDRAKLHTGSDKATADALGVATQQVSDWRHGRKPFPLTVQAKACEIAGMTEGEQMRHVWEVVRSKMGKRTAGALGAALWIGSTVAACALHAASLGSATMYIM